MVKNGWQRLRTCNFLTLSRHSTIGDDNGGDTPSGGGDDTGGRTEN